MAYNFPNSPTIGQAYQGYVWDGEKWTLKSVSSSLAGDALPLANTPTALPGVSNLYSRQDHVHPAPTIVIPPSFAAGTVMVFYQAAAPTGWTKVLTQNDKALRVVSGSGGVAGGTNAFSTVMAQTVVGAFTLDTNYIPYHTHSGTTDNPSAGHTHGGTLRGAGIASNYPTVASVNQYGTVSSTDNVSAWHTHTFGTSAVGASWGHGHSITMGMQYIDVILASKD